MTNSRILVLAPHTDDGEFGCGGTIARLIEEGKEVFYIAFSICEKSVPDRFPPTILADEVRRATETLGIPPDHLIIHRYPVRDFPACRQEILEDLVAFRRDGRPNLVFLPSTDDVHQDHQVVAREGIRAFKHTTVLGYELPWNNLQFSGHALIALQDRHLDRKIEAIRHYQSQQHRAYVQPEFIRSLARVRGTQMGTTYAEAFQVIRWILPSHPET